MFLLCLDKPYDPLPAKAPANNEGAPAGYHGQDGLSDFYTRAKRAMPDYSYLVPALALFFL